MYKTRTILKELSYSTKWLRVQAQKDTVVLGLESLDSLRKFYEKFKNEPPETAQRVAFEMGQARGRGIVQRIGLKGNDAEAIAKLLNAFFREFHWESESGVTIEGGKVVLRAGYYCPIMVSAMSLKLPWDWLDQNFAWPMMKGVASAVNPSIDFKIGKMRYKGDPICEHFVVMK